jgi:hypothetical protein
MLVLTRSFHGGDTENEGFCAEEHGIYLYIPGKTLVNSGVITEHEVSAGPYTVDSRTYADVHNEQDLSLHRRYLW